MLRVRTKLIATGALLAITSTVGGLYAQQRESGQQPAVTAAQPQRIQMVVHGMSCPFCAYGLEKKLWKLEGLDRLQ
ncbi:MAG: hypothetical protein ACT4PM_07100, partial [Gemmatimonadales bacterium]